MPFSIKNGVLIDTDGVTPVRRFGVVCPDLFMMWLANTNPAYAPNSTTPVIYQTNYAANFSALAAQGMTVVRFALFGYYPLTFSSAYITNNSTFVTNLDALFASAQANGILLIPSLFFNGSQLPPIYGEHLNAIGNPASATYAAMRNIITWFVNRYGNHPALAMIEFSNELDNRIGNNAFFPSLSSTSPSNGYPLSSDMDTPAAWTYPQDCYTFETVTNALTMFKNTVHAINPNLVTMSGNQGIRAVDIGLPLYGYIQQRIMDDTTDTLTAHTYYTNDFYNTDYFNFEQYLIALKAGALAAGKPLIIGEWGIPLNYNALAGSARNYIQQQIRVASYLAAAEIQLSLLWNYPGISGTDPNYDFSPNGTRTAEFQYLANFNAQYVSKF